MAKWPGFVGPSYTSQSKIAAYDRTVNWYCERIESGTGQATYVLYPTPGYFEAASVGPLPARGGLTVNTAMYYVAGTVLYQFPDTVVATGISNTGNSPVSMVTNGDAGGQMLIAADNSTYSFDLASHVLTTVGSTQLSVSIAFINGYGLRLDTARSEVSFSDPEDFTTWDALDVFQRNDAPDRWQRILAFHKELWCFGSATTSVYWNSGDADTPFQPITSVFIQMGIVAPLSACVVDGTVMWIGQGQNGRGVVYRANGYTPERISTHAVEFAFENIASLIQAEGSTYQENGHVFYELTFPTLADGILPGATWVYDATAGLWHERGVWDGLRFVEIDTRDHVQLSGQQYTFSRSTGKVYLQSISLSEGTDGLGIKRLRRAPHLSSENKGCIIDSVELKFEPGVALASGQGSDPQFAMRFSKNGGQTWSNTRTVSAGRLGEFDTRAIWTRLGWGRDRLIEITVSDPIFWPIIDAFVDVRTE